MAKNNQKKEKAARNREYARKFRKKTTSSRGRGPRPSMGGAPSQGAPNAAPAAPTLAAPQQGAPVAPATP